MQSISQFPRDFPIVFGVGVALLGLGINFVIFRFFGPWPRLVSSYADRSPSFVGKKWHFQSVSFNYWTSYRQCVTVGLNATGLYISPWLFFRGGHPPILIPWSVLQLDPKPLWFGQRYCLRTKAYPKIRILMPRDLFKKLKDENACMPDPQDFLS